MEPKSNSKVKFKLTEGISELLVETYFGSRVCYSRESVSIANDSVAILEVVNDFIHHFPSVSAKEQMYCLIAYFEISVLQVFIDHFATL